MDEQIESVAAPKSKLLRVILIGLVVVLVMGALTFGGYYFVTGEVLFGLDALFASEPEELTHEMDSFLVNLNGSRTNNYLKATIALSFMDPEALELVQVNRSQIRDTVIQYLRSKSQEEFAQSEDLEPFKGELKANIDRLLGEEIIFNIYFTEFLIQ